MPLIQTLQDNFDDNSVDAAKWNITGTGGATLAEVNQRIEITLANSVENDKGIESVNTYDFTNSQILIRVDQIPPSASTSSVAGLQMITGADGFKWVAGGGTLRAVTDIGGILTTHISLTYDSTLHKWWRIRENNSVLYWDTSSDGKTWTNRTSASISLNITAMIADIYGYSNNETTGGSAYFDEFNIITLDVAEASHSHSVDGLTLRFPVYEEDVQFVLGGWGAATGAISRYGTGSRVSSSGDLIVQDALHSHTADNIALTQQHSLVVQESLHSHTSEVPAIITDIALFVSDALHNHIADSIALTQQHTLAVAEASHTHSADSLALSQAHFLTVSESYHNHTADSPVITTALELIIQEALHTMTSDTINTVYHSTLTLSDALHAHTVDKLGLILLLTSVEAPTGVYQPSSVSQGDLSVAGAHTGVYQPKSNSEGSFVSSDNSSGSWKAP